MPNTSAPKFKRDLSEQALGWLLLSPVIILLLVIVVYPIATLVYNSFFTIKIMEPYLGQPFVGLENFERAFDDDRFWGALWNTVLYIVVTVPGSLVVGMGLALLANLPFKRQWPVRLALLLPWALPLVFVGLIFRWFFDFRLGFVNDFLVHFGFTAVPWLTNPIMAKIAICIAIIWKSSSFMALILLAGLQSIPKSLYEAADVDGASKWMEFTEITLPMLAPSIFVALIFRTITAIQTFDIPYAMTGGGPGESTETLAMYIHKTTLDFLDFGYGSALAVLLFLVSMIATSGYLKYTRRSSSRGDE